MPDVDDIMRELSEDDEPVTEAEVIAGGSGEAEFTLESPTIVMVPVASIVLDTENREAPEDKVRELAESIKLNGLIVPIIVGEDYKLIDGERRCRACALLGVELIPAVVRIEKQEAGAVLSNVQRENFSQKYLKDRFTKELKGRSMNQTKLAEKYGMTQGRVSQIVGKRKPETEKKAKAKKKKTPTPAVGTQNKAVVEVAKNINLIIGKREVKVVFEMSNADLQQPKTALRKLLMEIDFAVVSQVREETPDLI